VLQNKNPSALFQKEQKENIDKVIPTVEELMNEMEEEQDDEERNKLIDSLLDDEDADVSRCAHCAFYERVPGGGEGGGALFPQIDIDSDPNAIGGLLSIGNRPIWCLNSCTNSSLCDSKSAFLSPEW
jgi:hypothetical protein